MNNDAFSIVSSRQAKLCQTAKTAAANKKLTPHDELMQHRVTPETKLPPLEFLFKMNGIECFPLSELVANTGKAKSGKTLFLSIVMACCMKRNVLGLERIRETPIRVLWYDTEQSAQSTQNILCNRIIPLSHTEDNGHTEITETTDTSYISHLTSDLNDQFFVFNVRGIGWEKRRELLTVAISEIQPDLVIVDGDCAVEQHILAPGKDAYNQQGFFLNSPEQRQRILAYEEEQRRKAKEPVQSSLPFPESDSDDVPPY